MRKFSLMILLNLLVAQSLFGQATNPNSKQSKEIFSLIDNYSKARENNDTVLLKKILTKEVDQLVSTGEWRHGIAEVVKGMLRSSANSAGTRMLKVDKIRMINLYCAIVDCRYMIQNPESKTRKMWSTFVVVADKGTWKIAAIRNMLPEER
jgi:hypothetical protein